VNERLPAAVARWIERSSSDAPTARIQEAGMLGRSGEPQWSVPRLLAMLAEPEAAPAAGAVAAALRRLGEEPLAAAIAAAWSGDPRPAMALKDRRLGKPLLAALGARLAATRAAAAEALGHHAEAEPLEPLLRALQDPSPRVQRAAVRGLGQLRDSRALEPLWEALSDEDAATRREVASALGYLGQPESVEILRRRLRDGEPGVRRAAAVALGHLRRPEALPALAAALDDRSPPVREGVAWALGEIGGSEAVAALVGALADESDVVTIRAARSLGRLGDPSAIPALARGRKWYEWRAVRQACEEAIVAIRRAAGDYGGEVAPAAPPEGGPGEVTPPATR
jgi:HEAT repeat protein